MDSFKENFHKDIQWLLIDTFIFGLSGLILGFVVDEIIPQPKKDEKIYASIFFILLQIFVCISVIYFVDLGYESIFGRDSDETFGMTMFSIIFFISQTQLYVRTNRLYKSLLLHRVTD